MPIRAFLVMHVSVCLLITTTCSVVFCSAWLLESVWHGRPECFLFERLFQLFEGLSCRLTEPLCATGRAAVCRPCRAAFILCLRLFCCGWRAPHRCCLGLLVWRIPFSILSCRSDKLSGRRCITGCCFYPLLALLRRDFCFFLDWLLCFISVVGAHLTVFLPVFSRFFCVFLNICRFLLRLIRVVCFCNKC